MDLSKSTVLITGGSEGLGFAIAKVMVEKGSKVHILSRNEEKLAKAKEQLGDVETHQGDVIDYSTMQEVVKNIEDLNIVINNAGLWLEDTLVNNEYDSIDKVVDVNVKGVIYSSKAALEKMLEKNEGFIMNIGSTSSLKGRAEQSVYVATKFAVRGFTDSLKEELKDTNIKVAGFYPGGMSTPLFESAGFSKDNENWMDPMKVATVIAFILEQDDTMILDHVVVNKRV